ncbi:MAG: NUDIX hydrolase [Candidatus Aenigmatarchaeota archaeon]
MEVCTAKRNVKNPRRISVVVSCLLEKDGKILLVKRKKSKKAFPSFWGVPTGKVKAGETLEEALIREVKEETGLEVEPLKLLHITQEFHDNHHHLVFAFKAKIIGGNLKPKSDVCEARWFKPSEIKVKLQPVAKEQIKSLNVF